MNSKKPFWKSRTIAFNIFLAMFAAFSTHIDLLRGYLSDGGYMLLLMAVSGANIYLRTITTQGVK